MDFHRNTSWRCLGDWKLYSAHFPRSLRLYCAHRQFYTWSSWSDRCMKWFLRPPRAPIYYSSYHSEKAPALGPNPTPTLSLWRSPFSSAPFQALCSRAVGQLLSLLGSPYLVPGGGCLESAIAWKLRRNLVSEARSCSAFIWICVAQGVSTMTVQVSSNHLNGSLEWRPAMTAAMSTPAAEPDSLRKPPLP